MLVHSSSFRRGPAAARAAALPYARPVTEVRTFCRICEPSCGLVAEVDDGALVELRADRDHPVTKGFACHKGLAGGRRARRPRPARTTRCAASADGTWSRGDVGRRDGRHRAPPARDHRPHGPDAVAVYTGNPLAFNALGTLHRRVAAARPRRAAHVHRRARRTAPTSSSPPRRCSARRRSTRSRTSSTPTCASSSARTRGRRRAASGRSPTCINEMRQATAARRALRVRQPAPDRDARARRGRHRADQARHRRVLPRRAAARDRRLGGFDAAVIARHGAHVDGLREFIAHYPADARRRGHRHRRPTSCASSPPRGWRRRARRCTRRPASTWAARARSPTGSCRCSSFVTGRLDVEGGNLKSDGFYPNAKAGAAAVGAIVRRDRVRRAASRRAARHVDVPRHPRQRTARCGR